MYNASMPRFADRWGDTLNEEQKRQMSFSESTVVWDVDCSRMQGSTTEGLYFLEALEGRVPLQAPHSTWHLGTHHMPLGATRHTALGICPSCV